MTTELTLHAVAQMGSETLLTAQETAHVLRIGESTLERWRAGGSGPAFRRLGSRRVLYRVADVLAFAGAEAQAA